MFRVRLLLLMGLAMLSALALSVPVAQAGHPDDAMGHATCVLLPGVSGQTEAPGEDGVNSVLTDLDNGDAWDPLQLLDTDPGHFNFAGDVACAGFDLATEGDNGVKKPGPETFAPVLASIVASGDYDNLICGTGTANGDAVLFAPATPPFHPAIRIFTEFGIKFVAGQGELVFVIDADETGAPTMREDVNGQYDTAPDGNEDWIGSDMSAEYGVAPGHSFVGENQIDGGKGQGVIDILPLTGNCVTTPVEEFLVNGAFVAYLSGEGTQDSDTLDPDEEEEGDSDL